jgi:hypothetical protein
MTYIRYTQSAIWMNFFVGKPLTSLSAETVAVSLNIVTSAKLAPVDRLQIKRSGTDFIHCYVKHNFNCVVKLYKLRPSNTQS